VLAADGSSLGNGIAGAADAAPAANHDRSSLDRRARLRCRVPVTPTARASSKPSLARTLCSPISAKRIADPTATHIQVGDAEPPARSLSP